MGKSEFDELKTQKPYRIALRPDNPELDPMLTVTHQDDVVVNDVDTFHAELMDDNELWIGAYLRGTDNDRICFSVTVTEDRKLQFQVVEYPITSNLKYEHEGRNH
jgi:hypothetical protein